VLLDGTYGALNPKQTECARDVLAGGRHLLGLINDILDLSKIEAGKMELEREDVDVADVLGQAVTLVRPQAVAKEIALLVDVKEDVYWVNADADRLRQVLLNLLSNAVKFTPNGGSVRVKAEASLDGRVRVSVIDTGIGIAADQADKLFQEFSQVDGSIRRRFGGTGLGLAISKRLVEMHGGSIGFESKPGVGSTFYFALSAAANPHRTFGITRRFRRSSCSRLQPIRITEKTHPVLVLDADDAAARLAIATLEEAGIAAVRAATLAEARAKQSRQTFSAIVVDPPADAIGAETLHFAATTFGSALLVVSTRNEHEVVRSIGHAAFAEKPIDRATFVEKVRTTIARGQGPRTALVVDSNRTDAEAVSMLLVREGFTVQAATTLAAARIVLASSDPRLLVLDLDLADGDGIDLLKEVAQIPAIAPVVLTARKMDPAQLGVVDRLARIVAAKGTLSRSSFARQISMALQELGPTRRRILAIDDNEQNLRLVSAVLTARGYELLEARDATSGIAIARAERPDAILMDVMLPDVDGLSATRTLKRDALTSCIPVIALTANAMPGDAQKAIESGCCDHVPKPVDVGRLVTAIESAIAAAPPRLSMAPPARAVG
jgi:CheY-like chemotaxis protein/two-component sensor histidine kinase